MVGAVSWNPTGPHADAGAADAAVEAAGAEVFIAAARRAARHLPDEVLDALAQFQQQPPRDGALLVRAMPVGALPATPSDPSETVSKDGTSELSLLSIACGLGEPVGYLPEHGGDVVQNLVPTIAGADRQVSTSSKVDLAFHTETAFHPHAPQYLVLLCLRGDPDARTTLCSVHDVLDALDPATIAVLRQPRFVCGVDESFLDGTLVLDPTATPERDAARALGERGPLPVIGGTESRPTLWFDAELMRGTDPAAQAALDQLARAVLDRQGAVVLESGDCLIVDNTVAVHGRSSYAARFDGTDRWLQRAFVVSDLAPSAADRDGRIIGTLFR